MVHHIKNISSSLLERTKSQLWKIISSGDIERGNRILFLTVWFCQDFLPFLFCLDLFSNNCSRLGKSPIRNPAKSENLKQTVKQIRQIDFTDCIERLRGPQILIFITKLSQSILGFKIKTSSKIKAKKKLQNYTISISWLFLQCFLSDFILKINENWIRFSSFQSKRGQTFKFFGIDLFLDPS